MDHILLVLMVAIVGSLLLPAMQIARVVKRGQTRETKRKTASLAASPNSI